MYDLKSHSQFAEAAADVMRACALTTARAASTSMFQGMSFWTQVLRSSTQRTVPVFPVAWSVQPRALWNPLDGWAAWGRACARLPSVLAETAQPPGAAEPPAVDPTYASYRSSGGHAVAQVIVA